jgi:hypothetical protein
MEDERESSMVSLLTALRILTASGFQANFVCVDGQHDKDDFKITGFGSN